MKYMIVGIGINIDQSPNFQNYKTTHVNQHLKNKISKKKVFNILNRHLKDRFKIIKVPHYANYTNKEKYREQIKTIFKF